MYIIIETSRSGLCHMEEYLYGVNPKVKETWVGDHPVLTWHGCKAVQVRYGDPYTPAAYAFTCSDREQAEAFARQIPGFVLYGTYEYDCAYHTYKTEPSERVKNLFG